MANKLFLTSWPNGELRLVEILGNHKTMKGGIYIRYIDGKKPGGTDTTKSEFLFDIPEGLSSEVGKP
jgi:hypothetical protein